MKSKGGPRNGITEKKFTSGVVRCNNSLIALIITLPFETSKLPTFNLKIKSCKLSWLMHKGNLRP